ncbi:MAG: hypothetical protein HY758_10950 [Nitrospirae bacterium]|nr:hypothetical protein [Nitrospirota bacterium]
MKHLWTTDWGIIEKARAKGYVTAKDYVKKLRDLYEKGNATPETIDRELIRL